MRETLIRLKVTAGAKTEGVESQEDGSLKVRVRVKAEKGRANARVVELLAERFGVAKSRVELVRGLASREKVARVVEG